MIRVISKLALAGALTALLPGAAEALTREVAELQPARLTFDRSVFNQVTFGIYREPFDELQTRSYNLLFSNIGRHPNLSPWQGQEGTYSRYVNALIGNNGTTEVQSGVDSIQGSLIRRETRRITWGISAAYLSGDGRTDIAGPTTTFTDVDDMSGFDLRLAASRQMSESYVLGAGLRVIRASSEVTDDSFEDGVGGFRSSDEFDQLDLSVDFGVRYFMSPTASWEAQLFVGTAEFERGDFSENVDAGGAVTDRLVTADYDVTDIRVGLFASYNRLRTERYGETEFRVGLDRSERELDNDALSFSEAGGAITPSLTLLGQDPLEATRAFVSAGTILQAGQTELFTGAELGYSQLEGSTEVDAAGTIVNEAVDDSWLAVGLTLGLRQPLFDDKIRFIASGRADLIDGERSTLFDSSSEADDGSQTITQYALGIEGALANVTFDVAWLFSEDAPIEPVELGFSGGSRRVVEFDRLVVSAAVSW